MAIVAVEVKENGPQCMEICPWLRHYPIRCKLWKARLEHHHDVLTDIYRHPACLEREIKR